MFINIQAFVARYAPVFDAKRLNSPHNRRVILIFAALGFFIGIYLSIRAQPNIFSDMRLLPVLILVAFTVPVTVMLNAYEFVVSARLINRRIGFATALEIAIVGSAANMLPVPGATMVRVLALKAAGSSLKHGASTTFFAALVWAGVSFAYAGGWVIALGNIPVGVLFLAIGCPILVGSVIVVGKRFRKHRVVFNIFGARIALVILDAIRLYLAMLALGIGASFADASVLTVSGALGSAFSLVPAGLGLREAVAAAMAPLVTLASSAVFLATSLNRILGLITIAPFAIVLGLRLKGRGG